MFMALFIFITSCQKKQLTVTSNNEDLAIENGRIVFTNLNDFKQTYDYLKNNDEQKREDLFSIHYKNGFQSFNTSNLNRTHESSQKKTGIIDDDYDDLIADEVFGTILNDHAEIVIGDTLYKYTPHGLFYANIIYEGELQNHVTNLDINLNKKSIKQVEPCGPHGTTDELVNDNVFMFMPEYEGCGSSGGGGSSGSGGSSGGSSSTSTIDWGYNELTEFASNLSPSTVNSSAFFSIFGDYKYCKEYFDSSHRLKTKYWKQDYKIIKSIGIKSTYQKKGFLGIWSRTETNRMALGINKVHFVIESTPPAPLNSSKVFYFQNKLYTSNAQLLGEYFYDKEVFEFIDSKKVIILALDEYSIPYVDNIKIEIDNKKLNEYLFKEAGEFLTNLMKNQPGGQSEVKELLAYIKKGNQLHIIYLNKLIGPKKNIKSIRKVFDWSVNFAFKYTDNTNGSFSVNDWDIVMPKDLISYKGIEMDIYGLAYSHGKWKGNRLLFTKKLD